MKNKIIRYSALVLLVLVMIMIFCFSAQPAEASNETSDGVITKILSILYPDFTSLDEFAQQDIVITLVLPVRGLAHFSEFFLLGAVSFVFFSTFGGVFSRRRSMISFLFGLIYAASDEVHQIFVPGRACQLTDVLVDSLGVFTAIMLCVIISRLWRRRRSEQ